MNGLPAFDASGQPVEPDSATERISAPSTARLAPPPLRSANSGSTSSAVSGLSTPA